MLRIRLLLCVFLVVNLLGFGLDEFDTMLGADSPGTIPLPKEVFNIDGHAAFVIMPQAKVSGKLIPWVLYAPTFIPGSPSPSHLWLIKKFQAAGIAVAGIDIGESWGSPAGRAIYSSFYEEMISKRGFSKKVCLIGESRGGLMVYNWAAENPLSVACIAGIYPDVNLVTYPGLAQACPAYGLTEQEMSAKLPLHNPLEKLKVLADSRVPIFHIIGENDGFLADSRELENRYHQLGGQVTVKVVKGLGHEFAPEFFQSQELVNFLIENAIGGKELSTQSDSNPSPVAEPSTKLVYVTQSWDDAVLNDVRLVAILKKYKAKATFFVDPRNLDDVQQPADGGKNPKVGYPYWGWFGYGKLSISDVKRLYSDFEVGSHAMTHAPVHDLPVDLMRSELVESKRILESWFGRPVKGYAYPGGGGATEAVKKELKAAGYLYARTIVNDFKIIPVKEPYDLHVSLQHCDSKFWEEFDHIKQVGGVFHFWGHSFEMKTEKDWQDFENKIARLSSDPSVRWITVSEIFETKNGGIR